MNPLIKVTDLKREDIFALVNTGTDYANRKYVWLKTTVSKIDSGTEIILAEQADASQYRLANTEEITKIAKEVLTLSDYAAFLRLLESPPKDRQANNLPDSLKTRRVSLSREGLSLRQKIGRIFESFLTLIGAKPQKSSTSEAHAYRTAIKTAIIPDIDIELSKFNQMLGSSQNNGQHFQYNESNKTIRLSKQPSQNEKQLFAIEVAVIGYEILKKECDKINLKNGDKVEINNLLQKGKDLIGLLKNRPEYTKDKLFTMKVTEIESIVAKNFKTFTDELKEMEKRGELTDVYLRLISKKAKASTFPIMLALAANTTLTRQKILGQEFDIPDFSATDLNRMAFSLQEKDYSVGDSNNFLESLSQLLTKQEMEGVCSLLNQSLFNAIHQNIQAMLPGEFDNRVSHRMINLRVDNDKVSISYNAFVQPRRPEKEAKEGIAVTLSFDIPRDLLLTFDLAHLMKNIEELSKNYKKFEELLTTVYDTEDNQKFKDEIENYFNALFKAYPSISEGDAKELSIWKSKITNAHSRFELNNLLNGFRYHLLLNVANYTKLQALQSVNIKSTFNVSTEKAYLSSVKNKKPVDRYINLLNEMLEKEQFKEINAFLEKSKKDFERFPNILSQINEVQEKVSLVSERFEKTNINPVDEITALNVAIDRLRIELINEPPAYDILTSMEPSPTTEIQGQLVQSVEIEGVSEVSIESKQSQETKETRATTGSPGALPRDLNFNAGDASDSNAGNADNASDAKSSAEEQESGLPVIGVEHKEFSEHREAKGKSEEDHKEAGAPPPPPAAIQPLVENADLKQRKDLEAKERASAATSPSKAEEERKMELPTGGLPAEPQAAAEIVNPSASRQDSLVSSAVETPPQPPPPYEAGSNEVEAKNGIDKAERSSPKVKADATKSLINLLFPDDVSKNIRFARELQNQLKNNNGTIVLNDLNDMQKDCLKDINLSLSNSSPEEKINLKHNLLQLVKVAITLHELELLHYAVIKNPNLVLTFDDAWSLLQQIRDAQKVSNFLQVSLERYPELELTFMSPIKKIAKILKKTSETRSWIGRKFAETLPKQMNLLLRGTSSRKEKLLELISFLEFYPKGEGLEKRLKILKKVLATPAKDLRSKHIQPIIRTLTNFKYLRFIPQMST